MIARPDRFYLLLIIGSLLALGLARAAAGQAAVLAPVPAPGAVAPTGLVIEGPALGVVDAPLSFTARVEPAGIAPPVLYIWQAAGQEALAHAGGPADSAAFTWRQAGTKTITVSAATAQGTVTQTHTVNISHPPLDVVVVFDRSGSMNYETNCFDCWTRNSSRKYDPYPSNGDFNPLFYNVGGEFNTWEHQVCTALPASTTANGYKYMAHEAEFYSADVPLHGWEFDQRQPGQGFWVLQRTGKGSNAAYIRTHPYSVYSQSNTDEWTQLQGAAYNIECFDGPDLSYECWKARADSLGETAPGNVPWVEYDFTLDWDGNTSIWIRAVGGGLYSWAWNGVSPTAHSNWRNAIYWQVDGSDVDGGPFLNLRDGSSTQPSSDSDWRWVKIAHRVPTGTAGTRHVLKLYQGSAGFNLDKIVFTNNHEGSVGMAIDISGNVYGGSVTYIDDVLRDNSGAGPAATNGSASREACNRCNPAFGQTVQPADCSCKKDKNDTSVGLFPAGGSGEGCTRVAAPTNSLMNDLFHGEDDPIRSAQEAAKHLIARLDPRYDQVGIVPFARNTATDSTTRRIKLQCLRFAENKYAGTDGQRKCWDTSTDPISYTLVINALEDYQPSGNTNTSEGIREGLEELGVDTPTNPEDVTSTCDPDQTNDGESCDRLGLAPRVLILVTDGAPNQYTNCPADYTWNGNFGAGLYTYNCALYFAHQAALNGVMVFTIGLGPGVYPDLMAAMATGTDPGTGDVYFEGHCGQYFQTGNFNQLDNIFDQVLAQARACAAGQAGPALAISKTGPVTATAGAPFTYTLTVTNTGLVALADLLITDTIPAGAAYLSGGSRSGSVVSWAVPAPAPQAAVQVTFAVTATGSVTNSDYAASAGGHFAAGQQAILTHITPGGPPAANPRLYLPLILKP